MLVFALRPRNVKCISQIKREMLETWTTVKNSYEKAKTMNFTNT